MSRGAPGARVGHRAPGSLDPEILDINKTLNFHHEETSIH
ncbi:hypothetical protein RKD35_005708 [Streptomyces albogriseolus]